MWPGEATHFVRYPNLPPPRTWEKNWREIAWVQTFNSSHGGAVHTFQGDIGSDSTKYIDDEINVLATQLTNGAAFEFQIVRNAQQPVFGPMQFHYVSGWNIVSQRGAPPRLEVHTMPQLSRLNWERRSKHYWRKAIHEMVVDIFKDYDYPFAISHNRIEDNLPIPEFTRLRQVNLTDWQFIVSCLMPRARSKAKPSKAGYELFSEDGRKIWWVTQGYGYRSYQVAPAQFLRSSEGNQSWDVMDLGGSSYTATGYDHYRKKIITSTEGGSSTVSGSRSEFLPFQTQDGLDSWVKAHTQQLSQKAHTFTAPIRGDVELRGPTTVTLAGTRARTNDGISGFVVSILHTVKNNQYVQQLTVERSGFSG